MSLCAPIELDLEARPDWWKVRPAEIDAVCRGVKRGRDEVIAMTPAGLPVHAVFYGDFSEAMPQTNWSAGSSSSAYKSYFIREGQPQTFLFMAGIHGAEPESVAAAVNLIQMLETGKDFRGKEYPELLELIGKYRFIIIPCANMDGRAISPDHLRKASYEDFRRASQGTWKDGSLVGWLGSKEWFPLPLDKVSYPGGYPNSEGFNLMHDACPGHIRTAEVQGILRLCERWCVDAVLNGHSCEGQPSLLLPCVIGYPQHIARACHMAYLVNHAFYEAGLRKEDCVEATGPRGAGFNLNTMIMLASGAYTQTLECCVSLDYDFDQLVEPNFITLRIMMEEGLKKPLANRAGLLK